MKTFIALLAFTFMFSFSLMLSAQNSITIQWQKSYGGLGVEEAHSIQ